MVGAVSFYLYLGSSQSRLSTSPQSCPFLTYMSNRFYMMKRSNKNGHPGYNDAVSNSQVELCQIFQSLHLSSALNNISSVPLGEESGSLLLFHPSVAQQATISSVTSIYHRRKKYMLYAPLLL